MIILLSSRIKLTVCIQPVYANIGQSVTIQPVYANIGQSVIMQPVYANIGQSVTIQPVYANIGQSVTMYHCLIASISPFISVYKISNLIPLYLIYYLP